MVSNDAEQFLNDALDDEVDKNIVEADKRMSECFRRVFSTPDGRVVLHQILLDLKFYDECKDDVDKTLNNYAKFMIFKRLKCDNKKQITNLIMDIGD